MITSPSPYLRPCPPALPVFIVVYAGRTPVRLRLPSWGVPHRLLDDSASSVAMAIAIELGRSRYRKSKIYDVFLSFKGRNERRGFVDHLYNALTSSGLGILLDTHHLGQSGENIFASLQHAIDEVSSILIPIFSTNYAESAWCLKEASLIARQVLLQVKEELAMAIPLFYNVTSVQRGHPELSGSPFAPAFERHERSGRYSQNKWANGRMLSSN